MLADFFIYFGILIFAMWMVALIAILIRTNNVNKNKSNHYDEDDLFI